MFLIAYVGTALIVTIVVVGMAAYLAKRQGKNPYKWAGLSFFGLFVLVFWDYYPTKWAHQYYCEKEAGFWIYKTLEQWKAENPGVMETLADNSQWEKYPNWPTENWKGQRVASINQRFGLLYKDHLSNSEEDDLFLNVWRWEAELLDKKSGEILARKIDFSTGGRGYVGGTHSLKFWLQSDSCDDGKEYSRKFWEFINQFRGAKK